MPDTLPNISTTLASTPSLYGVFLARRPSGLTVRLVAKNNVNTFAVFFLQSTNVASADWLADDWTLLGAIEEVSMSQGGQKPDEEENGGGE